MRHIPVTRNFDPTQPIGYLELRDDVDIPLARNPYEGVRHWETVWKRLYRMGLHTCFSSVGDSVYVFGNVYLGEVDEVATMSEEVIRAKIKGEQHEREQ